MKRNTSQYDYFRLFICREGKVVLGKRYSTIWLLVAVMTATFTAIAFSNGSMKYLAYKMDDPFTLWVDIKNDGVGSINTDTGLSYTDLLEDLKNDEYIQEFHYSGSEEDFESRYNFWKADGEKVMALKGRFFENIHSPLFKKILEEGNVTNNWAIGFEDLPDESIGVIITEEALHKLGFDTAPSHIYLYSNSPGADLYGIEINEREYAKAPLPMLGVVKQLPGGVDYISTTLFYGRESNPGTANPFNMNNADYGESLNYFVPESVDFEQFKADFADILRDYYDDELEMNENFYKEEQRSFVPARYLSVDKDSVDDTFSFVFSYENQKNINDELMEKYLAQGVHRIYDYQMGADGTTERGGYLSVCFSDLEKIPEFVDFLGRYNVKIEMSQYNAKMNFKELNKLSWVLSIAMIFFAVFCIVLFIVNLLQSYFQKVKRNLGTFKAFGMGTKELMLIYLTIIAGIVLASMTASVALVAIIQGVLPVRADGGFGYLSLWCPQILISVCIIVSVSLFTVYFVINALLKKTPGDLIYDR